MIDRGLYTTIEKIELVPMLKIFTFLVTGVFLTQDVPVTFGFISLIITLLLIVTFLFHRKKYGSILSYLILIFLGGSLGWLQQKSTIPELRNVETELLCVDTTAKTNSFICESIYPREKLLVIVQDMSLAKPSIGDTLQCHINVEPIVNAHHTVKNLTSHHNIDRYAKVRVHGYDLELSKVVSYDYNIKKGDGKYDSYEFPFLMKIRRWCESRLSTLTVNSDDKSILKGMILGERKGMSRNRITLYQDSGISHYLAISGMHISILFMMLNIILLWSGTFFKGRIFKSIVIVTIIWGYTLMVGSPVSAIRAALMFSMMQVMMIRLTSPLQVFNSLFAVATLVVLWERDIVHNIGFQLSFMAVLSILLFMPLFISVIPKRKALKIGFSPLLITISAQIMTIPIVLYHFGYISFVSPITNVIATILLVPIFVIALFYIIFPCELFNWIIIELFEALNMTLERLTSIKYSVIDGLDIGILGVVIWLVLALLMFSHLSKSKIKGI